jgi:hypothetical protein
MKCKYRQTCLGTLETGVVAREEIWISEMGKAGQLKPIITRGPHIDFTPDLPCVSTIGD